MQHSYGFTSDLPDFPQNPGAHHCTRGLGGVVDPMELGPIVSRQHNPWSANPMIGRIVSPAPAFYATEVYMGLSRHDFPLNNNTSSFFGDSSSINQHIRPNNGSYRHDPLIMLSESEHLSLLKHNLLSDLDDTNMINPSVPFDPHQDQRVSLSRIIIDIIFSLMPFDDPAAFHRMSLHHLIIPT